MKTLKALKTKLQAVKKLTTAERIAEKFRSENGNMVFNYDFEGVNCLAGVDTIRIYVDDKDKFSVTYEKPVLFN